MNTENTSIPLPGQNIPNVQLAATDGTDVDLTTLKGISVVYAYPRTSPPNEPPIDGWDQIPGARGCTPQSKGYAEQNSAILAAGASRVFGLSAQDSGYQREVVERLSLPFQLLSDNELQLANARGLPTFEAGGMKLLTRITLILEDGHVKKVFFPVDEPAQNAAEVVEYLKGLSTFT